MEKNLWDKMSKVLGVTKVHANYKVTIPKELRDALEIENGDYIKFVKESDKITVKKVEG